MYLTKEFSKAIKICALIVLLMSCYNFVLAYFGIHGISISHPETNTITRLVLNKLMYVFYLLSFWILVGYLTGDYKGAIVVLLLSLILNLGVDKLFPVSGYAYSSNKINKLVHIFSGILPFLIFGIIHFKNSKGLKFIIFWAIMFGLSASIDTRGFEMIIDRITRIFGLSNIFEIRIPQGESSYRPINILQIIVSQLFLILKLTIFWWFYNLVNINQLSLKNINTIYHSKLNDKVALSIVYLSFRIFLFVASFGLFSFIANSFRTPINLLTIIQILFGTLSLIVAASIYRNLLVSYFISQFRYPKGLYFILNIPFLNLFALGFLLLQDKKYAGNLSETEIYDSFEKLKLHFKKHQRNLGWKLVLVIIILILMFYQLDRAGLNLGGHSRDGAYMLLLFSFLQFSMLVWYLTNKSAYPILIILSIIGIVLTSILRLEDLINPAMASGIVNMVVFYGLFYFDELKLQYVNVDDVTK